MKLGSSGVLLPASEPILPGSIHVKSRACDCKTPCLGHLPPIDSCDRLVFDTTTLALALEGLAMCGGK